MAEQAKKGVLLGLAAEGVVPMIGGCAGALAGGPEGGLIGVAVGQAVERVINFFGGRIVNVWAAWFQARPPEEREKALADLAALSPSEARREATEVVDRLAPDASPADRAVAIDYLSMIPLVVDRALLHDPHTGQRSVPGTVSLNEPQHLMQLLPVNLPPYPVGSDLPETHYRLDSLLGTGGFGAVYRASTRSLQHLPLAIKFCLDSGLAQALHRERSNLERLMKAGGEGGARKIVRLYGYDLEHRTPYLVYEYVPGGDLTQHLAQVRQKLGRPPNADEVLELVVQVVEALAFAHAHGLVHRDLKPANILVENGVLKLADFGLGGVTSARAVQVSRIGATTVDLLSVADQASLFRGAGTPLYMAPEQRRGAAPDPRHDLYSLGVMWYQLLVGDVSRELHPGWAKELRLRFGVPAAHTDLIERCVGWLDERPADAGELLPLLQPLRTAAPAATLVSGTAPAPPTQSGGKGDDLRESLLRSLVRRLDEGLSERQEAEEARFRFLAQAFFLTLPAAIAVYAWLHSVWASLGIGLGVFAVLAFVFHLTRLGKLAAMIQQVDSAITTLQAEFPDTVKSWGGLSILRDPETVHRLAERHSPPPARTETPTMPALEPAQRKVLAEQLRGVIQGHAEADRYAQRARMPFLVALAAGVVAGVGTGLGLGFMYAAQYEPFQHRHWRQAIWPQSLHVSPVPNLVVSPDEERYGFDYRLNSLNEAEYRRADRRATTSAVLVGVSSGVAAGLLVLLLLWRLRWYRLQMLWGLLLGVALGVGGGIGLGFLYERLRGPYQAAHKWYDYRGSELNPWQAVLEWRLRHSEAVFAGVAGGVALGLLALTGFLLWYHLQARAARRQLDEVVAQAEKEHPQAVQGWGGVEVLRDSRAVKRLLRTVEG